MAAMVPDDPPGTADSNLNEGEALINSHTTDINNNKSTTTTAAPTRGDTQTPPYTTSATNAPIPSSNIQTDIEESHGRGLGILFFLFFAVLRH